MNQTQTLDSDLQKAIDDITKTTSVDPVFSDPVAAPSSVPEGDDGTMGESIGPFPAPEPVIPEPPVIAEAPVAPEAPTPPMMPEMNMPPQPVIAPTPEFEPAMPVAPVAPQEPAYTPMMSPVEPTPVYDGYTDNYRNTAPNMQQVRESALRDLAPILDRISINPSQKFRIYRDMFENLHDYAVLEPAYRAAKGIADEKERGEALLYLIESIDRI